MTSQNDTLVIRDYPLVEWIVGLVLLSICAVNLWEAPGNWIIPIATGLLGFLFIGLASVLVIKADRVAGTLTISRSSLLRHYVRSIPVTDISAIQVHSTRGSRGNSTTYQVAVITKDNETIPFRNTYSSGSSAKESRARKLREFLGVGGEDGSIGGILGMASSMAQQAFQKDQEKLTGSEAEEHVTDGVHWKIQTAAFGGQAVTRWFSPDLKCVGGFVFLAQKAQGQGLPAGGLLAGLGKMLYMQAINIYGFTKEDTPGLDTAEGLASVDLRFDQHFTVFTSNPRIAMQYLNPWVINPLVDWGIRYPLKQIQKQEGLFGQLVVLFSPRGVYVASFGTMIPEAVQELADLGVAIVNGK